VCALFLLSVLAGPFEAVCDVDNERPIETILRAGKLDAH
jgi:hypothetical protein